MKVDLIPMTAEHVAEVHLIERSVFTTPWTTEMFHQEVLGVFGSRSVVGIMEGRVIGYRIAWFVGDEVHLVNIAVDKEYQTRGIGRLFLNDLIDIALGENKRIITLEVRASDAGAQAFYRRFHFKAIGVRKSYYTDNREDALIMVLDLTHLSERSRIGEGKSRTN